MSPLDSIGSEGNEGMVPASAKDRPSEDEGVGLNSLGDALAGVALSGAGTGVESGAGFSSFSLAPGSSATADRSSNASNADAEASNGWNAFSTSTAAAASTSNAVDQESSHPPPPSNQQQPGSHLRNDSLELFLSQSPSQTLGEDVFKLSHPNLPSLSEQHALESPDNGHPESDGFSLAVGQKFAPGASGAAYEGRGSQQYEPSNTSSSAASVNQAASMRGRTQSPTISITGTTTSSRSVSPFTSASNENSSNRHIGAYSSGVATGSSYHAPPPPLHAGLQQPNRYHSDGYQGSISAATAEVRHPPSFGSDDDRTTPNSASGGGLNPHYMHGSHPSLTTLDSRSPFGGKAVESSYPESNAPHSSSFQRAASLQQQHGRYVNGVDSPESLQHQVYGGVRHFQGQQGQQQPQVLYMAVPAPDGRGQVLQPVQMVQMPGRPYSYAVPQGDGGGSAGNFQDGGMVDGGNMMVLPPLPNQGEYDRRGVSAPSLRYAVDDQDGVAQNFLRSNSSSENYVGGDQALDALFATPQRPPLESLLGQVRRLSRDQVGCRLVQQALDEEGPAAATMILNEGLPFWGEAMVDPFGNYLFQKVLEKAKPEERILLVKSVCPRLVNASLNLHGTRSVQKLVELCAMDEHHQVKSPETGESATEVMTRALAPAAARLCIDSHGNHVIQRILLKLDHRHAQFVFEAVAASVADVARHRHGCCVIQRCLDSPPSEARQLLVHRIVEKSLELMQDAYGNYVVQYVLDVCGDQDVQAVCQSVVGKVNLLAIQKFSSNVMEKCLERCSDRVREMYLLELSDSERIRELMMDPFGNYVVQRALSVATNAQAIQLVEAMRPHLMATPVGGPNGQRNGGVRNTAGGRRIIAKICRRFPNFTVSPLGDDEIVDQGSLGGRSNENMASYHYGGPQYGHGHHGGRGNSLSGPRHGPPPGMGGQSPIGSSPSHLSMHQRPIQQHSLPPQQQQQQNQSSYYNIGVGVDDTNNGQSYYNHFANGSGFSGL